MALFDTPRIFKTPSEDANESASRVSALGLGQLFAHAYEGAKARAQQQLQFEQNMAQRKIEYQNNLDRLKQQQQLEADKWELGKQLENLQINQLQTKIKEDKAFADDLTVFQSWQSELNKDPNAPVPLDAMKSDRGKQLLINWRQQKINNNIELVSKLHYQNMEDRLNEVGAPRYERLRTQLMMDAQNGLQPNFKAMDDFWTEAEANGWVRPSYRNAFRQTDAERVVEATRLAAIARENGDDEEANRQEQIARIYANKSKAMYPSERTLTPQQKAVISARRTVIQQKYQEARKDALGDPEMLKAAEDELQKDELELQNLFSTPETPPVMSVSPDARSAVEKAFGLKPVDFQKALAPYKNRP